MEIESGHGGENRSPVAKMGRMEGAGAKAALKRQPLANLNSNTTTFQEDPKVKQGSAFTVYVDAPQESESLKEKKHEPWKQAPKESKVLRERKESVRSNMDDNDTMSLIAMAKGHLVNLQWSAERAERAEDSGVVAGVEDMSMSSTSMSMSLCGDRDEEEDRESAYASVTSEACSSSYYTAPLASAKDLHREQITTCPVYADEIFHYLLEKEVSPAVRISRNYMNKQTELNEAMRRTLVDWMVEVGIEYNLEQQTVHLAVRYVDRFLSLMDIPRHKLQLIGTTAIMIAAKLEEIYPPELKEYVFITDDTYSEVQVRRMERIMLEQLDFQLYVPTLVLFASRFLSVAKVPNNTQAMTHYLIDLSLTSLELSVLRPSLVAAAAVALASLMTDIVPAWPVCLQNLASLSPSQVLPITHKLIRLLSFIRTATKEVAVREKYSESKHYGVAKLTPPDLHSIHLI